MKLEELLKNKDLVKDLQDLQEVTDYNSQLKKVDYLTAKYGIEELELRRAYHIINSGANYWDGLGSK
ncbi:MAG: hypothetical protein EOL97_14555 [Spirochaetia bacterium]|nr:hypothetical protein [Spirochaetia bacterium]